MSAVDASGAAMALRASLLSSMDPGVDVANIDPRLCPIQAVTDCASLYDTIHKDGAVKLPSERRLVLDLIGLRELMEEETQEHGGAAERSRMPLLWVPTQGMIADGVTKRMDNHKLREALWAGPLTLREQERDRQDRQAEMGGWLTQWAHWAMGKEVWVDLAQGNRLNSILAYMS
jgi:hypothetical protein